MWFLAVSRKMTTFVTILTNNLYVHLVERIKHDIEFIFSFPSDFMGSSDGLC
jgi:hypothetical protein